MGNMQFLDWGSIDWIFEPQPGSGDQMKVGISHMLPGASQPRHTHSGDEQLMYIISGNGRQKIDDVEHLVEPGRIYHISSGMSHETSNDGTEDIVKLLISIPAEPASSTPPAPPESIPSVPNDAIDARVFLREAISRIEAQMLAPLKMPLSIYDADGQLVYQNKEYPAFCRSCCAIETDCLACPLYREKVVYTEPYYAEPSAFVCQYGLSLYSRLITCDGQLLGTVKAGHVRTAPATADSFPAALPYNVPSSTVAGILQIMEKICKLIANHYRFAQVASNLEVSRKALNDHQAQEELLQSSLKTSQNKAMNLRLNQHFLFNTLNMIMSTAIREGADQTYQAISNLAMLMQYTLRNDSYFVPLRREVDYLKNYTDLQKMRFGSRLIVRYNIDQRLLSADVPFMFLQPIVENAFKHGFGGLQDHMELSVTIVAVDSHISIRIQDNGCGMDDQRLEYLRQVIRSGSADHGTAMIARKLDALYGGNYSYTVNSNGTGTTVTVEIPKTGGN